MINTVDHRNQIIKLHQLCIDALNDHFVVGRPGIRFSCRVRPKGKNHSFRAWCSA